MVHEGVTPEVALQLSEALGFSKPEDLLVSVVTLLLLEMYNIVCPIMRK